MAAGSAVWEAMRTSPLMPWAAPILPKRMRLAGGVICTLLRRSLAGRPGKGKECGAGSALADQFDHVQPRFKIGFGHFQAIKRRQARDVVKTADLVAFRVGAVGLRRLIAIMEGTDIGEPVIG